MASMKLKAGATEKALSLEDQQAKIGEIRKIIGPITDKFLALFSDASILRFLRARNWNAKKPAKMMKETLNWRVEYKPEKILRIIWLIDFQGWSKSSASLKVTKETAQLLQNHYPGNPIQPTKIIRVLLDGVHFHKSHDISFAFIICLEGIV